jgi:glyoxylase-like metal-dependent hydrolase (beta-lactamase superfamily II)
VQDYAVKLLRIGYCDPVGQNEVRASCTITLVQGPVTVLFETGGPPDRLFLIEALQNEGLAPGNIDYVVCSHGHSDHSGNINLFPEAVIIVGFDICRGDLYTIHSFGSGKPFPLAEGIEVVPTPGHTGEDVSLIVQTARGRVAVVGDLFEDEHDEDSWRAMSRNPRLHEASRKKVLAEAYSIVPGHGGMFACNAKSGTGEA